MAYKSGRRANSKRGFGWIPDYLKATFGEAWRPDSQLSTYARSSGTKGAKRRDSRRKRQKMRQEIRRDRQHTERE